MTSPVCYSTGEARGGENMKDITWEYTVIWD